MHHRGEYRIRGQKKTEDDFDEEIEEQLKLSTHAKGQRRQNSAVLSRKHQESSQNSRLVESRANSRIGSSVIGSRVGRVLRNSRTDKNGVVDIQFNNVRWISIVSAYDSKRLKNVTISKQSCEAFVKRYGTGIKNDAAAMALFKDIKRHFHSWLARINDAFSDVIDDFLRVSERAPLQNFRKMEPILESISKDTNMMGQKLEGCLKIYENNDFRKLFARFQNFHQFSCKLEDLIKGIYQSKHRIDQLFAELENADDESTVDRKVDKIIKKGVREAEHIIDEVNGYKTSIRDRIISKVRLAINDMAEKSLSLFHKVQGAKDLIRRLHKLITDSRRTLQSSEIRKISKIFKAVIEQANKFQDFVAHFNAEQDHISPKLRDKLNEYSESIEQQKRAVSEIQILFVKTVINQAIETLKNNFILNNALSPLQHKTQYNEFNHTLEEISDAMLDQTSRGAVEGLIKHGKSNFSKLDDELEKIKRTLRKNEGIIFIDTENGEIDIMEYCNLTDKYKTKIKNLINKHEEALRNLGIFFREARISDNQRDPELAYLKDLRKVVETVNNKQRIDSFSKLKGFSELNNNGSILTYSAQATEVFNLMQQMNNNKKEIVNFNQANPLKNLIKNIRFENNLYLESYFILQSYDIINKINQKSLIENLTKLTQNNLKRQHELENIDGYRVTKAYNYLLERLYCVCLIKGLKKATVKELDDNRAIVFPENEYDAKQMENQLKYRSLIGDTIGQAGSFSKNKIKSTVKVMKDMISSFRIIERIDKNANGQFIILVQTLGTYISQFFKIIISSDDLNERGVECKKITIQCIKSLKSKISNIDLIDQQVDMQTVDAALKARNKIIKVQSLNQTALAAVEQVSKKTDYLEMFSGFIYTLTEYIQQSKQIAYIALNQFRQPIWLGSIDRSKDGIIAEIDLKGYKRGTFVDKYERQPPLIKKIVQVPQKKNSSPNKSPSPSTKEQKNFIVREKSHQKQAMDEEMAIESDKQMQQNIEESEIKQDNIEEINNDMVEEIADNMDEQINQIEDGIEDVEDGAMGEEINEEEIEQSPKKKAVESKQVSKKEIVQQSSKIEVRKSSDVSAYEIIPHFRELEEIRLMFLLIQSTETTFWSSQVDYQEVEDFYHRAEDLKDRTNFIKSLQSCFSMFINSRFQQGISDEIKRLDKFVSLKQKFNNFGEKNWPALFNVLSSIDFSYCLLLANKSQKQEINQIKISGKNVPNFKKEGVRLVLQNFLGRTFKSTFYRLEKFNLQEYLSYCFKTDIQQCMNSAGDGFHFKIKVIPQYKETLPDSETHSLLLSLEKIQESFSTNLVTGIDFRALMIQLWVKAVCLDAEDYYKPDYSTLNKYIKTLDTVEKKEWIGHYLLEFRQNILKIRDKIKSHKNLIDNTLFKIDSTNVWECIRHICELYQKKITQKTVYLTANKSQNIVYAICDDSAIGITSQSRLSTFLQDLFNRSDNKQARTMITQEQIITFIGKQYEKDESTFEMHDSITNLLNIMEIEHYYIAQPQIIIKNNIDDLVFTVIRNLNIKNKAELEYEQIFNDLFEQKKNGYTNSISLKKKIDRKIFTEQHIKNITNRLKAIAKQLKQNEENFKNTILNCEISVLFFDYLSGKSTNAVSQSTKSYYGWLKSLQEEFNSQLTSKSYNLFNYVKQKKSECQNLLKVVSKNLVDIEPLTKFPKQSSNQLKIAEQMSILIKNISKWMISKGFSKNIIIISVVDEENSWSFGLQFAKTDPNQYLKDFFNKYLLNSKNEKKENEKIFTQFYKKYMEKLIETKNNDNVIEINLKITKIPSQLSRQISQDLVQVDDILAFTRYYNQHRFNSNSTVLKKLQETHTKLIGRLKSKLFLVEVKELIQKCKWNGLEKLPIFKDLFSSFSSQLTYQKDYLNDLIQNTQSISVKETDLKSYIQWFKRIGVDELKMQYYVLKSSQKNVITIFPVAKIEKDKSKASQEIKRFLSDIKLPPKYSTALEQGILTINLEKEIINCKLADSENFLTQQNQLQGFDPDLPKGQIYLLSYHQGINDTEKLLLYVGEIKLQTQCILSIKEYETSSTITTSIWKIAKQDYDQWKQQNEKPNEQTFKALRKKMRGLAVGEQRVRDVCVGQDVNFNETGAWLRQELKKHHKRQQEIEKARQQRLRIEKLTITESEQFLKNVYKEMVNAQSLPTLQVTLPEAKKFKEQNIAEPSGQLKGYWKKILESNKKIIEKIEESKSSEQMSRISTLTKDYLKMLKIKLISNQQIEEEVIKSAQTDFSKIQKQRQIELQNKQKEKEARKKRRQIQKEQLLKKRLIQEASKLIQTSNPVNTGNTATVGNTGNIPTMTPQLQSKPQPVHEPEVEQESQSEAAPQQEIDECELILQCADFEKVKKGKQQEFYMSYLIFLLESHTPKDKQYYRCVLKHFWKLSKKDREALIWLK